jgi:segregation and condensation protein A
VLIGVTPEQFAELAAVAFRPKPPPTVSLDHLHVAKVSVREHAALLRLRLAELGAATFAELVSDCDRTLEVVARFLALLELYRQQTIMFDQADPLGELNVRWTGGLVQEAAAAADTDTGEDEEYG